MKKLLAFFIFVLVSVVIYIYTNPNFTILEATSSIQSRAEQLMKVHSIGRDSIYVSDMDIKSRLQSKGMHKEFKTISIEKKMDLLHMCMPNLKLQKIDVDYYDGKIYSVSGIYRCNYKEYIGEWRIIQFINHEKYSMETIANIFSSEDNFDIGETTVVNLL